ncbi:hypothetical protein GCM10027176_75660 [Actinoallomurus bryophytorum]
MAGGLPQGLRQPPVRRGGRHYRIQFPGPAGTASVEAALKLARKYTGRETIVSFTNAFHGMTLGSLSVTGNSMKRSGAGIALNHTMPMPFDNYLDGRTPDFLLVERLLVGPADKADSHPSRLSGGQQ